VGISDRLLADTGLAVHDPVEHARAVAAAQGSLGDEAFEREFARGRAMERDEAVAYALAERGDA
jgi:hypothetical protein